MGAIEVFKTNVGSKRAAKIILEEIGMHQPEYKCNFDLEDCDKVLRIETGGANVDAELIFSILGKNNHEGAILE
jgi:hypothetical protein